jgi:hypothetical protein
MRVDKCPAEKSDGSNVEVNLAEQDPSPKTIHHQLSMYIEPERQGLTQLVSASQGIFRSSPPWRVPINSARSGGHRNFRGHNQAIGPEHIGRAVKNREPAA